MDPFDLLSNREKLAARAQSMDKVRSFFKTRDVIEVDTFMLASGVVADEHIDLMRVDGANSHTPLYLLSSPESAMKQLLAKGSGDIFQLGHVYRKGEVGNKHSPVFTMLEWYQVETSFETFLQANIELLSLFLGEQLVTTTSYSQAFARYTNLSYPCSKDDLQHCLKQSGSSFSGEKEEMEHLVWATLIEPHLGNSCIEVITDYPAWQSALAKIEKGFAKRFEIYFNGCELANGYFELQRDSEYKQWIEQQNSKRKVINKESYPIDQQLISTLEKNPLPSCYGIAIGFDRLLMIQFKQHSIHNILPLPLS